MKKEQELRNSLSFFVCLWCHLLFSPQLARCEERLGLVEQSLSSTQDQLSARVSEVRNHQLTYCKIVHVDA